MLKQIIFDQGELKVESRLGFSLKIFSIHDLIIENYDQNISGYFMALLAWAG